MGNRGGSNRPPARRGGRSTGGASRGSAAKVVRQQLARERRRNRTIWTSAIAVVVLLMAGLIGWGIYAGQGSDDYTAPAGASSDGTGVVVGSGPVTIDLYEDFICPACNQFEQQAGATIDQLVADGRVRLVYHPVAYLDRASTTDYSTRSSAASGCAADGGKFRDYAKALFERQPPEGGAGLSDDELINIGAGVGLTGDDFASCVRDGTYEPWTRHVTEAASRDGVSGTPTVRVDGEPVQASAEAITAAVG
nr:thioredoxin domain-containing protein [Micromonospora sp. DSM 115978]